MFVKIGRRYSSMLRRMEIRVGGRRVVGDIITMVVMIMERSLTYIIGTCQDTAYPYFAIGSCHNFGCSFRYGRKVYRLQAKQDIYINHVWVASSASARIPPYFLDIDTPTLICWWHYVGATKDGIILQRSSSPKRRKRGARGMERYDKRYTSRTTVGVV